MAVALVKSKKPELARNTKTPNRHTSRNNYLPLRTTRIRTHNDTVLHIQILTDPFQHTRFGIQVVNRHIEETLNLARMEVHSDDMIASSGLQHVGHQLGGDRSTALVFLVLARIGEVGNNGRDAAGGGSLASIDHDEEFHKSVVDVVRSCGLQDEDWKARMLAQKALTYPAQEGIKADSTIFISYTFTDGDACFLVGVLKDHDLGHFNAEPVVVVRVAVSPVINQPNHVKHCSEQSYLSATSLASSGWLLPVKSLIELVDMVCMCL